MSPIVNRTDVAKKAGVSTATVSRVINNYPGVTAETRKKVEQVIEELDYKPNHMARGLKTNKTYSLVFLVPDVTNDFYTEVYKGIYDYALERGYLVSMYEFKTVNSLYEPLLNLRPDGIILGTNIPEKILKKFEKADIAVAAIGGVENEDIKINISIDLYRAMVEAVEYLAGIGHRQIGIITHKYDNDERFCGYREGIEKSGLEFKQELVIYTEGGKNHFEQGYLAMQKFLKSKNTATAIIGYNDLIAIGAMKSITEAGLEIAGNISIIGCDDTETARYINPPLSSIKIPKYEQGQKVAELMFNNLDGNKIESIELSTELILRESV